MHLSDYAGPPTWAVALRVLREHPAGLTLTELQELVRQALAERLGVSRYLGIDPLEHLVQDGCVVVSREVRACRRGHRRLQVYRVTEAGLEALDAFLAELAGALDLPAPPRQRRQAQAQAKRSDAVVKRTA